MEEDEDDTDDGTDKDSWDPLCVDDPIYSPKKDYVEEKFVSEQTLIDTLIFEEKTIWDIGQTTWFDLDNSQIVSSYCPCGKINRKWLKKKRTYIMLRPMSYAKDRPA